MLIDQVHQALKLAVNNSLDEIIDNTYWCGEVHSNAAFTAQYIFLRQQFDLSFTANDSSALIHWLFSQQNADGSWGIAPNFPGDVSTTTETYLALKILGVEVCDPRMLSARLTIIKSGGIPVTRMLTRIFLASFGLISWSSIPALPTELILLPTISPINIYNISSWCRTTCVPLLLVRHHEPVYRLPNGLSRNNNFLNELHTAEISGPLPYATPEAIARKRQTYIGMFFTAADHVMMQFGRYFNSPLRGIARRKCVQWIIDHQENSGQWAGYWPPHQASLWALSLEGYTMDHPVMRHGFEAINSFVRLDKNGIRVQVTVSQVWDTTLTAIALSDSAASTGIACPPQTVRWLLDHEISSFRGDWRILRPNILPGGFAFEEFNTLYPDIDDTTAVVIALIKSSSCQQSSGCILRATNWILGMQNSNGGWAAFDWNNDKDFLNEMPFSDMDNYCDPSTADVTGGVIECFGIMLSEPDGLVLDVSLKQKLQIACFRAVAYLLEIQEQNGSWWGRWGINYIYGTSHALCGLSHFYDHTHESEDDHQIAVNRAVEWLKNSQNPDGGWGESPHSYSDARPSGCILSTSTQTAWAIMALLNYIPAEGECIQKGVMYLIQSQVKDEGTQKATWPLINYTATGFPGHLYMEFGYYRHYFPIMALGRYASKISASKTIC
jgi:squalene-hopene/tetraprenyl-beta-curcumene cyclase